MPSGCLTATILAMRVTFEYGERFIDLEESCWGIYFGAVLAIPTIVLRIVTPCVITVTFCTRWNSRVRICDYS